MSALPPPPSASGVDLRNINKTKGVVAEETKETPHASTAENVGSTKNSLIYSTNQAVWTPLELHLLHKGLIQYSHTNSNNEGMSNLDRYIKIAATLPKKNIRDVAFKIKAITGIHHQSTFQVNKKRRFDTICSKASEKQMSACDDKINQLLQENVSTINKIRENLISVKLEQNKEWMTKFCSNCDEIMQIVGSLNVAMPPMPVKPDNILLSTISTNNNQYDI